MPATRSRNERRERAGNVWALVLAGGAGMRLRPLVRRIHSDDRPKQYAVLWGSRSLLERTLDRVSLSIPPQRTVIITTKGHGRFLEGVTTPGGPHVLTQPQNRGTAAGLLYPLHWIARKDREAVVAVFPSDHFVGDDERFMAHVGALEPLARVYTSRILIVGARAETADTSYGWIEPAEPLPSTNGTPLRRVARFLEKPSRQTAEACLARGCLWNTFVMVGRVGAFVEAGRAALPELHDRLARVAPCFGTRTEALATECAYASAPNANFSAHVLAPNAQRLAVSRMPPLAWSDWGTPERVTETLRRRGIEPDWLRAMAAGA